MLRKTLLAGVALAFAFAVPAAQASDNSLRLAPEAAPSSNRLTPAYGSINPFYGSINPFYGQINPFYGSINPFYGQISPFWGDIEPYWGKVNPFYGSINPFYGETDQFWGKITPFYGTIQPFWGTVGPYWETAGPQWGAINDTWTKLQAANATDYSSLQSQIRSFLGKAAAFWSPAVGKYTHKSFADGFANDMLAKYGIDPNDPASLAGTDAATRSFFFLNWYDGLMNFTGVDHVDWWMPAVHWSPSLTQIQGGEGRAIVGILDSSVSADGANVDRLKFVGGYKYYVNDHGAAVASLIAAEHDGQGVMGVDPNAEVHLYNPFDASGTASWNDVASGIAKLYDSGAHVVNASLGVPGTTVSNEWVNILSGPLLSSRKDSLVIVKAAGNEGVKQTQNVAVAARPRSAQQPDRGRLGRPDRRDLAVLQHPGRILLHAARPLPGAEQAQIPLRRGAGRAHPGLRQPWRRHADERHLVRGAAGDGRGRPAAGPLAVAAATCRGNGADHLPLGEGSGRAGRRPRLWLGRARHRGVAVAARFQQAHRLSAQHL